MPSDQAAYFIAIPARNPAILRRALCDSRVLTVVLGLVLLSGAATLYWADQPTYLRYMRIWLPEVLGRPFADSGYIISQLSCWRQGVNVYLANSCEMYQRAFAYPPLWLRLWFLPDNLQALVPFSLVLDAGFIVSLAVLPRLGRARDIVWLCAAITSSATVYGVERGNVDLAIFILAAVAIPLIERRLALRVIGYATLTCAALLKFYPLFLLALIARERRRVAILVGLSVTSVVLGSVWLWHDQWLAMFPNIPGPEYRTDGPGGRKLPEGLFALIDQLAHYGLLKPSTHLDNWLPTRAATAMLFAMLMLPALFASLRLARNDSFATAMRRLNPRETLCLLAGALLFCGCFVLGTSIAYREVFLLFALPALFSLQYDRALPRALRWIAPLTIPLMWATYPALLLDLHHGPLGPHGGPWPTFAFWLVREIIWWWLFIVLAAGLFRLADDSGIVSIGDSTAA
jgi:hypothetical protein